jgi:hypothetical protein
MTYKTEILNEREKSHGPYNETAIIAQTLKGVVFEAVERTGAELAHIHLESLDMICSKMARILSGNPNVKDHWDDIAGYAKLVSENL